MKVELSLEEREPLLRQLRVAVAADGHALGFKTRLSQRGTETEMPALTVAETPRAELYGARSATLSTSPATGSHSDCETPFRASPSIPTRVY